MTVFLLSHESDQAVKVSGQFHALAVFPPKKRAADTHYTSGFVRQFGRCCGGEISLQNISLFLSSAASSLVTIPTELPWEWLPRGTERKTEIMTRLFF